MTHIYGSKLDPYRKLREPLAAKGIRQSIVITNNPSTIDQNQVLTVKFPNLGPEDVIVPGTARLAFNIELASETDPKRTLVDNLGRAIIKTIKVKFEGNEVFCLDDADVFYCYKDLWLTKEERLDRIYQGIQGDNIAKLRIDASDKSTSDAKDVILADTYGTRFCIPLEFEILTAHMPYYQGALNDRLSFELTFNDYSKVIKSTDTDTTYKISNISLEYEIVTHTDLARNIHNQYQSKLSIYFDRVIRHSLMHKDKADTVWNINLNTPARSLKGILMLFVEPKNPYSRESEKFYNPKITHLSCTIEGRPNQVYASGMLPYQHYEEITKYFAGGRIRERPVNMACKDLHLYDVRLPQYLTNKYALWLDLRTSDDDYLHGSGRPIENGSDGITIQIQKKGEAEGALNVYLYLIYDAKLNIVESRHRGTVY